MRSCSSSKKKSSAGEVQWTDIAHFERLVFGPGATIYRTVWLKRIWNEITTRGFTAYHSYAGKQRVLLRFMTLATIYYDFSDLAFDRPFFREVEILEWIKDSTLVNPLHFWGRINWQEFGEADLIDLDYLLVSKTGSIIDEMRTELVQAIRQFYANDLRLCYDMIDTVYDCETDYNADEDENQDQFIENFFERQSRVLLWIRSGMPRPIYGHQFACKSVGRIALSPERRTDHEFNVE